MNPKLFDRAEHLIILIRTTKNINILSQDARACATSCNLQLRHVLPFVIIDVVAIDTGQNQAQAAVASYQENILIHHVS